MADQQNVSQEYLFYRRQVLAYDNNEVGAYDVKQYLRKAEAFSEQ